MSARKSSILPRFYIPFLLTILTTAVCSSVMAQTDVTGAVQGRVFDLHRNTPLPGVVVQIINEDTQVPTSAKTDANGNFIKQGLPPGRYLVRVRAVGYKLREVVQTVSVTDTRTVKPLPIPLDSEQPEQAPPVMTVAPPPAAPGATTPPPTPAAATTAPEAAPTAPPALPSENVTVTESLTGEASTTDARLSGSFNRATVNTLPVGSSTLTRSFDEFAFLLPGVALPPQTSGGIAGPGVGPGVGSSGQFAVNGLRSRGNNFTVDGSDNNDEDIGVRRQGFFALVPQPIESIEQYQVTTALAPAQYGRNFGAQINAVSRSGGAKFHGDVYGFFNASQLNARNAFDTAFGNGSTLLKAGNNQQVTVDGQNLSVRNESGGKDSFTLGQGGFTFGGPLTPATASGNRAFFFLSGEQQVLNSFRENSFAVPTVEERGTLNSGASGLFFNPLTCANFNNLSTCAPGDPNVDFYFPTSLQGDAVFSLFPFANNPNGVYGRNTLTQSLPANARGLILSARGDADATAFSFTHHLALRYNYTDDKRDLPTVGGAIFSTVRSSTRTNNFAASLNTQVRENINNELRASYGRTDLDFTEPPRELRRPELLPSVKRFNEHVPFLLNTRYLTNNTLPSLIGGRRVANTGPVLYELGGNTETGLGGSGNIAAGALGPLGQVVIAGYSPVGVDVFSFPQSRVNNTYQIADNLSLTQNNHRLTFGGDLRRAELNSDLPRNSRTLLTFYGAPRLRFDTGPAGTLTNYRFDGFYRPTDLAAAQAASGTFQTLAAPGSSSRIGLRYYQLYFFGQDEWRLSDKLSLSYGLRYEYTTPAREVNQTIERNFSDPLLSQLVPGLNSFVAGRSRIFNPDRNNFAPRVGVVYNFYANTIIRAGFGAHYDQIVGAVVSQSRNAFPSFLTLNSSGGLGGRTGGSFDIFNFAGTGGIARFDQNGNQIPGTFRPYIQAGTLNTINPALVEVSGIAPIPLVVDVNNREFPGGFGATLPARDLSSPEAYQYAVTVEKEVAAGTVVSVGYVGTQGRHLLRFTTPNLGANVTLLPLTFDRNAIVPDFGGISLAPGATLRPGVSTPNTFAGVRSAFAGGRPNAGVGAVNIFETSANSRYNAVQAQVRGRYAQGLQYQLAYTFSDSKDDVSDVFDLAGASSLPQNSLTRAGEYARSNFDAQHRLAYSFVYDFGKPDANHGRAYRILAGGFQVAGTGSFQTGQPFTVNSIFDVNLDGNLTDRLNLDGLTRTGDASQPLRAAGDTGSFLAQVGRDGLVPRNSFRAGKTLDLNLSLIKRFSFTEAQGLTFRMDVFNFIDRANYGVPVRFLEAPGFGRATETTTPGRRIQFGLKYSF